MKSPRKAALLCLAAALLLAGCHRPAIRRARRGRQEIARRLAEYLAERHPGSRAVVISNPFTRLENCPPEVKAFEESGLDGLRRGFGDRIHIEAVDYPELLPGADRDPLHFVRRPTTTPLSYLVATGAFTRIIRDHPGAAFFVSLIGIPAGLPEEDIWHRGREIHLAFLLPDFDVLEEPGLVREAFASGLFTAAIVEPPRRPGTQQSSSAVLVTAENVDQVLGPQRSRSR